MNYLFEAAKRELIKRHNARKAELEAKVSKAKEAWDSARSELDAHAKTHPNYEAMKARRDAKNTNDGWEEGRSTPRRNGNW